MFFTTRLIRFLQIGVGISNTDVEYADSTDSTAAPTTGWQTNAPKWQNGHFIWTRTHITYTDGRDKYTTPVCLPSGKGIAKIVEQYYSSTSATSLENDEWSTIAPAWVNGRYIWTRSVIYYTDGTSETTSPVCTTGGKGAQGEDAITVQASLMAIAHHKSSTNATYRSEVKLLKGTTPVEFSVKSVSKPQGVSVIYTLSGDAQIFNITIPAKTEINGNVSIVLAYNNKTYPLTISIATSVDGEQGQKGEVGAALRGPQSWSDLGDGYTFEAGDAGDEWKDVVIYGDIYYSCVKGHVKTADNYPGSPEDNNNGYWRAGKPMEIIATQILLSKFAFINNLGAKAIEMYDKDNKEVVFKAYNGELFCKVGTFENVKVSGDVNATSGSIGGFTIQQNQLHSAADGYSFDIYKDRLVYVDQKNQRTLSIMSGDSDGLRLSLGAAKNNGMCNMQVTDRGVGLVCTNGYGFKSEFTESSMIVSRNNSAFSFWIDHDSFGNTYRFPTTTAGIRGYINKNSDKLRLLAVGLPTSPSGLETGEIYVENGILKLKS